MRLVKDMVQQYVTDQYLICVDGTGEENVSYVFERSCGMEDTSDALFEGEYLLCVDYVVNCYDPREEGNVIAEIIRKTGVDPKYFQYLSE